MLMAHSHSTSNLSLGLLQQCHRGAHGIVEECQEAISSDVSDEHAFDASGAQLGLGALPPTQVKALSDIAKRVAQLSFDTDAAQHQPPQPPSTLLPRLNGLIKETYTKFYDFTYQDLPYCWRQLYTDLSILKFCCLFSSHYSVKSETRNKSHKSDEQNQIADIDGDDDEKNDLVTQMVATLDKALILAGGAGIKRGRRAVERMLALLEEAEEAEEARRTSQAPTPAVGDGDGDADPRPAKRQRTASDGGDTQKQDEWQRQRSFSTRRIFEPELKRPIRRFDHMSMEDFQRYMDQGQAASKDGPLPFIVRGLTDDWPAMTARPWRKPAYLLSRTFGGRRLVPVEVGRSYVDDGWGQELITFGELLRRMEAGPDKPAVGTEAEAEAEAETKTKTDINTSGGGGYPSHSAATAAAAAAPRQSPISYLAQHELFTQLPVLRNDIPTPDLCHASPPPHPTSPIHDKPELPVPLLNAWLGPAGTITPLHTDGYHNLLAQVVGAKYVRLYSPLDSEALCPRGVDGEHGVDMHNTSAYDVGIVEGWDEAGHDEQRDAIELEEFRGLRYWEAVLEEGDALYVPIGWWHYVRSLSVSFSVSFWWNGDHYRGGGQGGGSDGEASADGSP